MNQDVLARLNGRSHKFSKGQRAIAAFLGESYDKAAFMTAAALGKAVGVSESTVVRFAMELGYEGYPELQKAMQEMVVNRLTAVQRIEVTNDRIGDQLFQILDAGFNLRLLVSCFIIFCVLGQVTEGTSDSDIIFDFFSACVFQIIELFNQCVIAFLCVEHLLCLCHGCFSFMVI